MEKLARTSSTEAADMERLLNRMTAARATALELGDIPYVHEPANSQEIQLLIAQAAYLIATEEGTRHLLWPLIQKFLP